MPAEVRWYNTDKNIIEVIFSGNWNVNDFVNALDEATQLSHSQQGILVSVIINAEKSAGLPRNANLIPHFRSALHNNLYDYIIFAGGTSFGLTLVRLISRIMPDGNRRIFFANSVAEAEDRIHSLRART